MSFVKINYKELPPMEESVVIRMSKEFQVILFLFVIYALFLFLVPILCFTATEFMKTRVWGGMSLAWFLTAIGVNLMAFGIAGIHVHFYKKDFYISRSTLDKEKKGVNN
jgi:uncharacterized membrane protein (DUF485 family)